MILITGTVDVDPEQREAALSAAQPHMRATRALEGCLDYVWSADPLVPGRIYVYERWQSRESLEAHFASPHYPAMRDTIAAHGVRGLEVSKHRISLSEPVYDPQGRPRADFFSAQD
ncbi:MAG: antibiotic biosynthesis monooxygenase [Deltaproteobacteria bacterium]|nr:MAG: antibiotic biosynthesis monooxygenase [Deltaproteobacteria bacterium]